MTFFKLFLLFTIIPVVEIYLFIRIGELLGLLNIIFLIIATAAMGAHLAKSQGFAVLNQIQLAFSRGEIPGNELLHGLFILVGGITLLTPGFFTDVIGFTMLIPQLRALYINLLTKYFKNKIDAGEFNIYT